MRIYGNNCKVKQTQGPQRFSLCGLCAILANFAFIVFYFNAMAAKVFAKGAMNFDPS